MDAQLGQRKAETSISIKASLVTEMIIETECISKSAEKISSKKSTLKHTGSSHDAIEESIGNVGKMEGSLEPRQGHR